MRFILFLLLLPCLTLQAQRFTISGYVKDASTGEDLLYATVYNKDNTLDGVTTNLYGFYSLTLEKGVYTIVSSYTGYNDREILLDLNKDTTLNIELSSGVTFDSMIVVTAEEKDANVESTQMGTIELDVASIKKLPALLGEVDILKTIQLLLVFYRRVKVRLVSMFEGGLDQNLILLDEAVVYNSGHLLGFFSVFNSDAIASKQLLLKGECQPIMVVEFHLSLTSK